MFTFGSCYRFCVRAVVANNSAGSTFSLALKHEAQTLDHLLCAAQELCRIIRAGDEDHFSGNSIAATAATVFCQRGVACVGQQTGCAEEASVHRWCRSGGILCGAVFGQAFARCAGGHCGEVAGAIRFGEVSVMR